MKASVQRLLRFVGYAALTATPIALLTRALVAPADVSLAALGLGGGVMLVGGAAAAVEHRVPLYRLDGPALDRSDLLDVLAVVVAAGVTHLLNVHAGLGPVVGSAFVGVVAALTLSDTDTAAYCGSFVGMASPAVFEGALVLAAGLVAGLAFVAAADVLAGFGGKLGTLAMFGCATAGLLAGVEYAAGSGLQWSDAALVGPVAVGGAVAAAVLSVRCGLGTVLGSALVGLAAGLALPVAFPDVGGLLATVAFCASFVGMSTRERLASEVEVALAGALCGVVFVAAEPVFVGVGGKLGTTAFVSCVALGGVGELRERLVA